MGFFFFLGEYWIDPNEGDIRDAVLVWCDEVTKSTCIKPQPDNIGPIDFGNRHSQPEFWLSEFENVSKVCVNYYIFQLNID